MEKELKELGGDTTTRLSDDTEHMKKELVNASKRSDEKMENLLQSFQTKRDGTNGSDDDDQIE